MCSGMNYDKFMILCFLLDLLGCGLGAEVLPQRRRGRGGGVVVGLPQSHRGHGGFFVVDCLFWVVGC